MGPLVEAAWDERTLLLERPAAELRRELPLPQ
jgi:hypothetical protein